MRKSEVIFIASLFALSVIFMLASGLFPEQVFTLNKAVYTVKGTMVVSSVVFGFFGFFCFGCIVARCE